MTTVTVIIRSALPRYHRTINREQCQQSRFCLKEATSKIFALVVGSKFTRSREKSQ